MGQPVSYRDRMGTLSISRGVIDTAKKVVIYGPEGIGKSTLASKFPGPLFLDVEGSTKAMDIERLDGLNSWQGLRDALAALRGGRYGYKTVVIDTADWAEKLAMSFVCSQQKKSGIEEFGYGKGYVYLKEAFAELLTDCDALIAEGMNIVFTAHAAMRKFEQPDERGAYDRWEMKLTKHDAPLLKEWADMVLFCNYKTFAQKTENGNYKAAGGRRVMYATHNPCWDAKNRYGLADELPMDYAAIRDVIEKPVKPDLTPQVPENAEPVKKSVQESVKESVKESAQGPSAPEPAQPAEPQLTLICSECGQPITGIGKWSAEQIASRSMKLFGQALCVACAKAKSAQKSA